MIDIPATITAVGALVTAVGIILIAYWAYRGRERAAEAARAAIAAKVAATDAKDAAEDSKRRIVEIGGKLFEIGKAIDGRLTMLLEEKERTGVANATAALAKGKLEGRADEKAENVAKHRRASDADNGGSGA